MKLYIDSVEIENNDYYIIIEISDFVCKRIKFYIDKKTYININEIISNFKPFRNVKNYKFQIAGYGFDKENSTLTIEAQSEKKRLKAKVKCSEFFLQNIHWIFDDKNFEDLKKYCVDNHNAYN